MKTKAAASGGEWSVRLQQLPKPKAALSTEQNTNNATNHHPPFLLSIARELHVLHTAMV